MAVQEVVIYGVVMGTAGAAAVSVYPLMSHFSNRVADRFKQYQKVKVDKATKELDEIFVDVKPTWLKVAYGVGPVGASVLTYLVTQNRVFALIGAVVGLLLPDLWVRHAGAVRRQKFQGQLVDALFILSSSLRAGLSMTQAFEQLATEMSPPASQEYGLVVKAHRLGRSLEHALEGLNERMRSDELRLVTTAVLLARETGGDITTIISQLITTIRERKKLKDKVSTLTLQGRFQAYIMSALPVLFAFFVNSFNPGYFQLMLEEPVGQLALVAAVVLWIVGIILLAIMSRVEF